MARNQETFEVEGCTRFEEAPDREAFGFEVVDQRDYTVLAWRGEEQSAIEIANQLNDTYPDVAPATDTLIHEIRGWRIAGVTG